MSMLSPQSILDGRTSNRAPLPVIFGLVASGICALLALAFYLLTGGPVNVAIGALLALPTAIVLVGLILLVDRLEPEPRMHLLLAFGWGAGVAILGSLIVNTVGGALLVPLMGVDAANAATAVICAPVVEESFKGALLLLLLWWRRHEIDGLTDGIVYASLAGVGFALVENILYYMRGLEDPAGGLVFMVLIRGVIAPLGHSLYTSLIGLGVAYAATHRGAGGFFAVVGGWLGAVGLHALWNGSTLFGMGGLVLAYLFEFLVLMMLVILLVVDRRKLVGLIRTHLPAYVPSGLVQPSDIQMLGTLAGRRQARRWALHNAGATGVQAMGDYQLAATELALLHSHAAKETVGPEKFHDRRNAILALMGSARNAFFRGRPQAPAPPWAAHQPSGFIPKSELQTVRLPGFQPAQGPPRGRGPVPPQAPAPAPGSGPPPRPGPGQAPAPGQAPGSPAQGPAHGPAQGPVRGPAQGPGQGQRPRPPR